MDSVQRGYANVRHKLLNEGWDYVTIVSGPEGAGKSNLALLLGTYADPDFTGDRVAFDLNTLLPLLESAPKGATVVFDEAVQGAYRREAMTGDNRNLNKVAMIARKRGVHLILCIPNFWDLDSYFRDHRARAWFLMQRRGEALLHFPSRNNYKREVFWRPTLNYDHGYVDAGIWTTYDQRKDTYIARELRHARDPDAEGADKAAEVKAEAAQEHRDTVEAIRRAQVQGVAQVQAWFAEHGNPIGYHKAAALNRAAWPNRKGGRPAKPSAHATPDPTLYQDPRATPRAPTGDP